MLGGLVGTFLFHILSRIFCANHTINEVYNTLFLSIVQQVLTNVRTSIVRLGEDGIEILNLVVPKPEIPADIAHNYKQVKVQWTEQLVANQTQKTEEIRKKTELIKVCNALLILYTSLYICPPSASLYIYPLISGCGRRRETEGGAGDKDTGANIGEGGPEECLQYKQ